MDIKVPFKILVFEVQGKLLSLPVDFVREVIPSRPMTAITNSATYIRGVIDLRGETIPIADTGLLLDEEEKSSGRLTPYTIISKIPLPGGLWGRLGLTADKILSFHLLDEKNFHRPPTIGGTRMEHASLGVANFQKLETGETVLVPVLDLTSLSRLQDKATLSDTLTSTNEKSVSRDKTEPLVSYITIFALDKPYAVPLEDLEEVCILDNFCTDALVPAFMTGYVSRRGTYIGAIEAAHVINQERSPKSRGRYLTTYRLKSLTVGLIVDRIGKTVKAKASQIQTNDLLQEISGDEKKTYAFIETADGPLPILNFKEGFSEDQIQALGDWAATMKNLEALDAKKSGEVATRKKTQNEHYLIVRIGDHLLGLSSSKVDEIVLTKDLLPFPKAEKDFSGILLRRGIGYSILNLRKNLDLKIEKPADRRVVVLIKNEKEYTGIEVDDVIRCMNLDRLRIKKPENIKLAAHRDNFEGLVTLEEGEVHLLDLATLLNKRRPSLRQKLRDVGMTDDSIGLQF